MRSAIFGAFLALAMTLGLSSTASAAEYDDAIMLSWDQETWSPTSSETFWGTPVTVPGDSDSRTLYVRNDGPSAGVMTAEIFNVKANERGAEDTHHNPSHRDPDGDGDLYRGPGDQGNWYDDLFVQWDTGDASFSTLDDNGVTRMWAKTVQPGEVVPVELTYSLADEVTSGNGANVVKREASLSVRFDIEGDTPDPTDPPTPPSTDDPTPDPSTPPSTDAPPSTPGQTPPGDQTPPSSDPGDQVGIPSGQVPGDGGILWPLIGAAIGLLVAALAVFRKATRHKESS